MKHLRWPVLIAVVGIALAGVAHAERPQGLLDGKRFELSLTKPNGDSEGTDRVLFAGGKLESSRWRDYGFTSPSYKGGSSEGAIFFKARVEDPERGTVIWSGTVRDESIQGTVKWVERGGRTVSYRFEGEEL